MCLLRIEWFRMDSICLLLCSKSGGWIISRLSILSAERRHSGIYSCSIINSTSTTVDVQILNGTYIWWALSLSLYFQQLTSWLECACVELNNWCFMWEVLELIISLFRLGHDNLCSDWNSPHCRRTPWLSTSINPFKSKIYSIKFPELLPPPYPQIYNIIFVLPVYCIGETPAAVQHSDANQVNNNMFRRPLQMLASLLIVLYISC